MSGGPGKFEEKSPSLTLVPGATVNFLRVSDPKASSSPENSAAPRVEDLLVTIPAIMLGTDVHGISPPRFSSVSATSYLQMVVFNKRALFRGSNQRVCGVAGRRDCLMAGAESRQRLSRDRNGRHSSPDNRCIGFQAHSHREVTPN